MIMAEKITMLRKRNGRWSLEELGRKSRGGSCDRQFLKGVRSFL